MSPVPKADHLRTELISDALTNAIATRDPKADVVFHSDRGCQRCLRGARPRPRSGSRSDWPVKLGQRLRRELTASLKGECLDTRTWATRPTARRTLVEYIGWFNGSRRHSSLGYLTPNEYQTDTGLQTLEAAAWPCQPDLAPG